MGCKIRQFLQPKQVFKLLNSSALFRVEFEQISYLSLPSMANNIDWERDNITLNNSAVQKESTLNPPTILVHNKIIMALITNKNKPKVTIVNGKVNNTNIGFIKRLSNPKTTATSSAVPKPAT